MATLLFSGSHWLLPGVGLFLVVLLVLAWSYRPTLLPTRHRAAAFILKGLGFAALIFCLLEPLWSGNRARPGANLFVILADNSQGMQILDRGELKARSEQLRALVTDDQADWQLKLNQDFEVRRYVFDTHARPTKDFAELTFDGRSTSLGAALRTIADRFQGRPLAGVLLLSDGNATDLPNGVPDLTGVPPVYPVVMGRDQPGRDIALQNLTVSQTSFEDAPVVIQATVVAVGYAETNIVAQLFDQTGKKVEEQSEKARQDQDTLAFRFQTRPEKSGISFYRLQVATKDEIDHLAQKQSSSESTLANNSRVFAVDRGRGPFRILYVAGRPNWEFKFLNRALAEDEQVQLVGLIRVADRVRKFDFRGRTGEASNPLFRGFDRKDEETERYDQAVLRRINVRDEAELRSGFPKTPEDLYEYQAIVLDDVEAGFFTREQMTLLQKFVSERGGGFLMLGGQESFQEGKYDHTPIGDMMPVYLDRASEIQPSTDLRLDLTREGWLQPWMRLRKNEADERTRLESAPAFQIINHVRGIKPGASAIAMVVDAAANHYPALVVQRFGRGRTAALTIGDLWRWGLRNEALHKDMDKAWRQMMRWLVSDVPQRIELQAEQKPDANQSVLLQVRIRDKKFQPLDNATVSLEIQSVASDASRTTKDRTGLSTNQTSLRITAEPALSEAGLYQATYIPRETGAYKAEATAVDATGLTVGHAEVGWTSDPAAEEFSSLKPNRALLEQIARATKGEVIEANQLQRFAQGLPNRSVPITEAWTFPLWHTSIVFLFALICFVAEWGLRRWKGLV